MMNWDLFLDTAGARTHELFTSYSIDIPYFKKVTEKSYNNFRALMQLIDCALLDVKSLQYKPKALVCSFMYLLLGICLFI